ncbi:MAG: Uma2 family endonuclease [Caldilineaceae bacterium]|nr:Uma2 family endonuclease [Caldilineaceae bacterium]
MSLQVVEEPTTRRKFTVDEYHKLIDAGVLHEDDRVELIAGEIHTMSPIDAIHAAHVKRLNQLLGNLLDDRLLIGVQDPILLDDLSEPEPDISILRWRDDFYAQAHPSPADVLLLIEVANTSASYDRNVKLPTYAAAGIAEVWIVNIKRDIVEQYTLPDGNEYTNRKIIKRGTVSATHPELKLTVPINAILGLAKRSDTNAETPYNGNNELQS